MTPHNRWSLRNCGKSLEWRRWALTRRREILCKARGRVLFAGESRPVPEAAPNRAIWRSKRESSRLPNVQLRGDREYVGAKAARPIAPSSLLGRIPCNAAKVQFYSKAAIFFRYGYGAGYSGVVSHGVV